MAQKKDRNKLKRSHEKAVADRLIGLAGINAVFDRMGNDASEPDVLYIYNSKKLGIEVSDAYHSDLNARQDWTLAAGERDFSPKGYELAASGVLINPDQIICNRIQSELQDKTTKKYSGCDWVWLCINQHDPWCEKQAIVECARKLIIPQSHCFDRIFVMYLLSLREGGTYEVVELPYKQTP